MIISRTINELLTAMDAGTLTAEAAAAAARIERLQGALDHYGYVVTMDVVVDEEIAFAGTLAHALERIEGVFRSNARHYCTRGMSKRARMHLHMSLPTPVWGVDAA